MLFLPSLFDLHIEKEETNKGVFKSSFRHFGVP